MTDPTPDSPKTSAADRIAKVMARAGVASRREAERMIVEGRVSVNGKKIDSPALDVLPTDRITVDGKKLDEPQETRMWLYYKPLGLITSESDEKGRQTVFDALPRDLPRVMTVGRLDLNSEGLLLLTNDGELKRRLELPSTGWLRRYRVRVNGTPNDMTFDPLRRGVTIEGEDFAPMEIKLDSQQGANAWLTVGIREGKNREIRRAMAHVGLQVNRLIRIGYGPFKLTGMEKNEVVEVKRKVLRDQLGGLLTGEAEDKPRAMRPRGAEGAPRDEAGPRRFGAKPASDRAPRSRDEERRGDRPARSWGGKPADGDRPARNWGGKPADGDRPARNWGGKSDEGDRPRFKGKPADPRQTFGDRPRDADDKARWKSRPAEGGDDRKFAPKRPRPDEETRPARFKGKPGEGRKPFGKDDGQRFRGDAPEGGRKPFGKPRSDASEGARKPREGAADAGRKPAGGKPGFDSKPRPAGGKGFGGPKGGKPAGGPRPGGKPRPSRG
ncbi:MAG: pseudouridine synthase [Pseudomonadota bacterium]|nr:pseudouridine synthase [Pseudomonadota bacterium]